MQVPTCDWSGDPARLRCGDVASIYLGTAVCTRHLPYVVAQHIQALEVEQAAMKERVRALQAEVEALKTGRAAPS
jgi:hypothetical protein